jgi:hypothetical protein
MPISAIDGCLEAHWSDVREIIDEAIEEAGFLPNLVSNADDVGIIQKRIIQNLYENPVVVCDVSGKNPNVMFELGLRLAFDKPTIIIKDDKTSYSFDTSPIEHLEYPRDLRFGKIVEFKEKLAEKIQATHERAASDQAYTTFLKHFGEFTVVKLDKKEVPGQEFMLEEIKSMRLALERLEKRPGYRSPLPSVRPGQVNVCLEGVPQSEIAELVTMTEAYPGVKSVRLDDRGPDHQHIVIQMDSDGSATAVGLRAVLRNRTRAFRPKPASIP